MPSKITAWKCDYCSRYRVRKASVTRHEQICFSNPNRKILEGQLAVFATMPRDLVGDDSYGVPNSSWSEPIWHPSAELLEKYKWWPLDSDGSLGIGYVYSAGEWGKIPGYVPPTFSPGCCWKDEQIPDIHGSIP